MNSLLKEQALALWIERTRRQAWFSALGVASISLLSFVSSTQLDQLTFAGAPHETQLKLRLIRVSFAAVAAAIIVLLLVRRKHLSQRALRFLIAFIASLVLPMIWVAQTENLRANAQSPILGAGFYVAIVAFSTVCAGSSAFTLMLYGAVLAEAIAFLLWYGPLRGMPALTYIFGMIGAIIIGIQYLNERHTRRSILLELQARADSHLARVLLSLRDRANSPLQALELGFEILAERSTDQDAVLEKMRGAFTRLSAVHASLRSIQPHPAVESLPEEGFPMGDSELDRSLRF